MTNTNFVEIQGNIIRKKDISLITNVVSVFEKNKKGGCEWSHFQSNIVLTSGHVIVIGDYSEEDCLENINVLFKALNLSTINKSSIINKVND